MLSSASPFSLIQAGAVRVFGCVRRDWDQDPNLLGGSV